jgi:hypothetical protein
MAMAGCLILLSDCKINNMCQWFAASLILVLACWNLALADSSLQPSEFGINEEELTVKARQGRLTQDELIKNGEDLSCVTRLKFYLYAKELEPFFEGVEDSFRDLARSDPRDQQAVDRGRNAIFAAMNLARQRLLGSGREQPETDWRRGLVGLIWLDQDWRNRVYEQGKDEIKNPYDLVALVDCLDARLRNLEGGGYAECPAVALPGSGPKSEKGHE